MNFNVNIRSINGKNNPWSRWRNYRIYWTACVLHWYFVSDASVLVHNNGCKSDYSTGKSKKSSNKSKGVGNPVKTAGRKSAGRTTPSTLAEQMAMHEV